jgi:hypothetical protein
MSKSPKKFNYTKWSFIIGSLTAIAGAIATVIAVPDIGCKVGWNSAACVVPRQEIDLITQSETGESLAGVKIQFIAKGAPEVQFTDSNGYAKVQIPSEGDVRINLSKTGYPVQDFIINLENAQSTVRVIRFSSSGQPEVQEVETTPTPIATPTLTLTPTTTPTPTANLPNQANVQDFLFVLEGCYRSGQNIDCQLVINNQGEDRRKLELFGNNGTSNTQCVIFADGNRYVAGATELADQSGINVALSMPSGINIVAKVSFPGIPEEINKLEAVEFWIRVNDFFPLKFSDVSVSTK